MEDSVKLSGYMGNATHSRAPQVEDSRVFVDRRTPNVEKDNTQQSDRSPCSSLLHGTSIRELHRSRHSSEVSFDQASLGVYC